MATQGETRSLSGMQKRAAGHRAHNRMVIRKLVLFSMLMAVAPLSTFFCVRSFIGPDTRYADAWSGVAAVLMTNIVIGLYILSAWMEDDEKEAAPPVGRFATAKPKQQ